MLDLRRLRLLRELKIRGTLADVAAALSYSPSSVSQQLAQLEKEVGVPLLRKTGRRVALTAQAEVLVAHTAELLETMERAEADLAASLTTVSGTVRVAVFQSAALALMPDALTAMTRDYPDVRANTVSSFALGDYEWILAFEADQLERIVDLMRHLRATDARRHVREEVPFYTGRRVEIAELTEVLS